jgi:uncharacterized membrane protein YeiB
MDDKGAGWASSRERFTVWTAVIMALGAFLAIIIACFTKDMTTTEKIVTLLISFVGTPLGYLFGYSTTKSAEVSANEKVAALEGQITRLSEAIETFRLARQADQQIIGKLEVALERERKS